MDREVCEPASPAGRVSMSSRSTKPRSSSGASSGYGRCPANRLQRCGCDRCSAIAEAVSRAAVRLTSLRVKAYRALAPVHGGLGLADRPPQVKDPPDLAEEVQEAPRAAFLGSGCCAQLAAESFQYQQRRLSCRSRVLSDPIIVAPSDGSPVRTMELDLTPSHGRLRIDDLRWYLPSLLPSLATWAGFRLWIACSGSVSCRQHWRWPSALRRAISRRRRTKRS